MPTFLHYLGLATLIYLCFGFGFALAMTFLTFRASRRPPPLTLSPGETPPSGVSRLGMS